MVLGAYDGVTVIEWGHFLLVPTATVTLADWGADVIKVEHFKAGGDQMRFPSDVEGQPPPDDIKPSLWFHYFNRGKRSLGLDMMTESGLEIIRELVKRADVFVSNYDLRATEKAKMDYDSLREINPKLVYCHCTGYGSEGPDRYKPGFESPAWWARSGMMDRFAGGSKEPETCRIGMGDITASQSVAGAISAALLYREKTGKGQKIDINLYHQAVWATSFDIGAALHQGVNLRRIDRANHTNFMTNSYKCKDEKWIMLQMPHTDRYWPSLCQAIEKPEWEQDPRFDSHNKRMEQKSTLIPAMELIMAQKTAKEWEAIAQNYDLVLGRVQTPLEVANDPQAWENNFFVEVDYGPQQRFKAINSPVKFSETPGLIRGLGPELGQHTEEILLDFGYNWDDLIRFKSQGAIM
jgi:crotonobetainyl-CoA:carnitine CoA-transferase CaiB-like acyl-CoA transferase